MFSKDIEVAFQKLEDLTSAVFEVLRAGIYAKTQYRNRWQWEIQSLKK